MWEYGEINLLTILENRARFGGIRNRYMLRSGFVCRMFRVDVAFETKVVLGSFFLVASDVVGGFFGGFLDCESVSSIACFDVDCCSGAVGHFQKLQEMGRR
jgi:hypothetical protein